MKWAGALRQLGKKKEAMDMGNFLKHAIAPCFYPFMILFYARYAHVFTKKVKSTRRGVAMPATRTAAETATKEGPGELAKPRAQRMVLAAFDRDHFPGFGGFSMVFLMIFRGFLEVLLFGWFFGNFWSFSGDFWCILGLTLEGLLGIMFVFFLGFLS